MSILKHSRSARRVVKAYPTFQTGLLAGNPAATPGTRTLRTWYRIGGAPHRRWYLISIAMTMAAMIFANLIPRSPTTLPSARSLEVKRHSLPPTAAARRCSSAWHCGT